MSETKTMNRWLVVVGAILIQLCLGAIYAWSVFTPALKADSPAAVVEGFAVFAFVFALVLLGTVTGQGG